jgi:oxygen-dependent protoporphyrinogen oxidase
VHNKFPHRAPEDRALLRCFFAGRTAEEIWGLADDQIVGIVRNELQQILGPHIFPPQIGAPQVTGPPITGLRAEPLFARVYKWKSAMAQYGVGHLDRLDRIERLRRQLPGLALAGNAYRGIGVPDCVRSGSDAAKQMIGV